MANEHEGLPLHAANTTHNGRIIQACAVAVQLHKLVCDVQDDVQAGGPVGVAGNLQALHWSKPTVRLAPQLQ